MQRPVSVGAFDSFYCSFIHTDAVSKGYITFVLSETQLDQDIVPRTPYGNSIKRLSESTTSPVAWVEVACFLSKERGKLERSLTTTYTGVSHYYVYGPIFSDDGIKVTKGAGSL